MQRFIALLTFAVLMLPLATASDHPQHGHATYVTGLGLVVRDAQTPPTTVCSTDCPLDLPFAVGGADIAPDGGDLWHDVLVELTDAHWGTNSAFQACPIIADPVQPACGFDSFAGCGSLIMFVPFVHMEAVHVDVYALHVGSDLQVCGSTTGEALAAFFHGHT